MRKLLVTFIFLIVILLVIVLWFNQTHKSSKPSSAVVKTIGQRGLFIGGENQGLQSQNITDDTDFAWDNIGAGKDYFANGQYKQAAEAFSRAYSAKYGSKSVSGLNLARSYEKLGEYGKGIQIINDMIQNGYLSDAGIEDANVIESRLLAAKASQEKAASGSSSSGE